MPTPAPRTGAWHWHLGICAAIRSLLNPPHCHSQYALACLLDMCSLQLRHCHSQYVLACLLDMCSLRLRHGHSQYALACLLDMCSLRLRHCHCFSIPTIDATLSTLAQTP